MLKLYNSSAYFIGHVVLAFAILLLVLQTSYFDQFRADFWEGFHAAQRSELEQLFRDYQAEQPTY